MKRPILLAAVELLSMLCHAQTDEKTLFLISNTHLDTQWNWDVKTTINEYVKNTLVQNTTLMGKYPNFRLNYEGAIKYMWMKEYYPAEYAKLQRYIDNGQWHVSGLSVDANDVMMASAESILRNFLYANQYYKKEFGVRGGYDIMLPDCFGFSYALPSLARHAGIRGFHSQKLSWGNAAYDKLPPFGRWQGVDGSQIYAIYKPGAYDAHEDFNKDLTNDESFLKKINDNQQKYGMPITIRYVGPRSDHGGGLKDDPNSDGENTPYWLNYNAGKTDGKIRVKLATPDEIFDYFDAHNGQSLPLWNSELPMRSHGVGAYTSKSELKRWNRRNELLADAAEKASSMAQWLGVRPYPQAALNEAWIRNLWQQHHDGLPGTSIPKADEYSRNEFYLANKAFAQELSTSAGAIANCMDTQVEGTPVVVYNPLVWERTDVVEGSLPCAAKPQGLTVYGPDGQEVLSQILGYEKGELRFIFAATVPSLGYAVYDVHTDRASSLTSSMTTDADLRRISNGRFRVSLSANGDIQQLYDEENSRAMTMSTKTQLIYDHQDTWPAWEISYTDECRNPSATLGEGAEITLAEDGPLRKSFRVLRQKAGSTVLQYIRMTPLSNRVDVVNEVDWQTYERMLKVLFTFPFTNAQDTYDISLGTIKRGIRSADEYEVAGHQWADHSNIAGTYGVSVLNNCKYGWDKPANNQLRLTLQHTPSCGLHGHHADMGIGPNHYTYSLFPHGSNWLPATQREAAQLNQPLVAFTCPRHQGTLGRSIGFATASTDEVSIKALKKAEETDELIVRVYEWAGTDKDEVRLQFPANILSAREVNALEETIGEASVSGSELVFPIGHYQPKTFAVRLQQPSVEVEQTYNADVPLTFNCNTDLMSYDANITNGNTSYSYLYPAELVPDELSADGVTFRMGNRANGKYNALRLSGHSLTFERQPGQDKLYLLWASASPTGSTATVTVGEDEHPYYVPYFTGLAGEPLTTANLQAHYTRENIAFTATHAHGISSKANEIMRHLYMYKVCIDLPEGVTEVRLSSADRKVFLFAATLSANKMDDVKPLAPLTTEVDYVELSPDASQDGRLEPTNVTASHQINSNTETGAKANDQDPTTKWCVGENQSKEPYLEYYFREPVIVERWLVLGATRENSGLVAESFKLQYYNEAGKWVDADLVKDNKMNKVARRLATPVTTQRVRLQMLHGEQGSGYTTRIYEFAVYGHLESETGIMEPADSQDCHLPITYYNLNGMRLSSPQPGVNIIKQGNKVRKVLY